MEWENARAELQEDIAFSYCIISVPYGDVLFTCRDVTRFLQLLLRREGYVFKTSSEFEIVRQIKEVRECRV